MRVNLKITEKTQYLGVFKRGAYYSLNVHVIFEPQELNDIKRLKIGSYVLFEEAPLNAEIDDTIVPHCVNDLVKKNSVNLAYPTRISAEEGMEYVKEQLRNLKDMFGAPEGQKEESFEL